MKYIYRTLIELTNGKWSSFLLKKFVQSRMSRFFIYPFIKIYKIDTTEMEKSEIEFASLHEFFIRKLKQDSRPICREANSVISPVDGVVQHFGDITQSMEFMIKGKVYSLSDLFNSEVEGKKYREGKYILFYLSPRNYHRVHSPISGKVIRQWPLGNKSYPVNKWGLKFGREPLSKNFRIITEAEHSYGVFAIIKIGAMFVNSIVITNDKDELQKGDEIAYFAFGSSVLLLFEKDTFSFDEQLQMTKEIKVGERIGYIIEK